MIHADVNRLSYNKEVWAVYADTCEGCMYGGSKDVCYGSEKQRKLCGGPNTEEQMFIFRPKDEGKRTPLLVKKDETVSHWYVKEKNKCPTNTRSRKPKTELSTGSESTMPSSTDSDCSDTEMNTSSSPAPKKRTRKRTSGKRSGGDDTGTNQAHQ